MIRGFLFLSKLLLLCAATIACRSAAGQSTAELAQKNLQRQKWQRAYELLTKALSKDSLNVTAKYVLAQYFFSEQNPSFHLDSAYRYALAAAHDFQSTSIKQREKLRRFPLDSAQLITLRQQIEEMAFVQAKSVQTEKAWINFIDRFFLSSSLPRAIKLRDSLAYQDAVQENTYQGFQNFFIKYPQGAQAPQAKQLYEKLLFEAETSDQTLQSFETFLAKYPDSPYRSSAEQNIFEYKTASGEWQTYIDFVRTHPSNVFVKKAKDILFHLIPDQERSQHWPADFTNDSLARVMTLEHVYLAPVLREKKFGFIDSEGNEIIAAAADSIDARYLCGNIVDDIISSQGHMISKNCACVLARDVRSMNDIGAGFLVVETDECRRVIHKTGFVVGDDCIDDASILNGKLIAIRKANRWSVWTLTGKCLTNNADDVFHVKDVIALKEEGKIRLLPLQTLTTLPSPPELGGMLCDEARSWNNDLIFVKRENNVGLLDQSLNVFVDLRDQLLTPAFCGVIATDSLGSRLINHSGQQSRIFTRVVSREPWVAVKDSVWRLLDPLTLLANGTYDTLVFHGPFVSGNYRDSTHIFFTKKIIWKGLKPAVIEFIPGNDSTAFLLMENKSTKTIFDDEGKKLFSSTYDKIQYAGQGLFIVHRKEKKGLLDTTGKTQLPVEYDAIGSVHDGIVSMLKSTHFGLYDCIHRKRIPAVYEKNLVRYNEHTITAYKNGMLGFIDWNNKALSNFEFNEIEFWNDTTALVKKNSEWMLYEIRTKRVVLDNIKDYKYVQNTSSQKVAIVYRGIDHGVIHNKNGTILPISFSYIINVGSPEKPLYFTEKHITEADIFIVIYYNDQGKLLRKEVYDQEDYEKIYCDDD